MCLVTLQQSLSLSLYFTTLVCLKRSECVLLNVVQFSFVRYSFVMRFRLYSSGSNAIGVLLGFHHWWRYVPSVPLLVIWWYLEHVVKVVSAKILHNEVSLLLFVLSIGGENFWLNMSCYSSNIHPLVLAFIYDAYSNQFW